MTIWGAVAEDSLFFGAGISLLAYCVGLYCRRKWKSPVCNPLLFSIVIVIGCLWAAGIEYDTYYKSAKYLSYLLTPATVSLAIPLYEQLSLLRRNWKAILCGILSGALSSLGSTWALAKLFALNHQEYVTLLPKSITTAIGMSVSEELGGYVTLTVAVIVVTGIFGNIIAEAACKWFHITEPIAKGVAIGSSSHAIGTAKALEMGETEGAVSGLSIVVSGLFTVVFASIFAQFL